MLVQDVFNGTRSSFHQDNTSWEIRKWDGLLALRSPPLVDGLDALALLSLLCLTSLFYFFFYGLSFGPQMVPEYGRLPVW
jgi:hypothetical protein